MIKYSYYISYYSNYLIEINSNEKEKNQIPLIVGVVIAIVVVIVIIVIISIFIYKRNKKVNESETTQDNIEDKQNQVSTDFLDNFAREVDVDPFAHDFDEKDFKATGLIKNLTL